MWIPEKQIYTYPDVMVTSEPLQLQAGRKDTIVNPILIAEVLSELTEAYDRGSKFAAYRTISSLQNYLLIAQDSMHIELYSKTETNQWLLSDYEASAVLSLPLLPFEISLTDIYSKVSFEPDAKQD